MKSKTLIPAAVLKRIANQDALVDAIIKHRVELVKNMYKAVGWMGRGFTITRKS